ncbi:heterogeneous nuclear ribonucleoprotein K-like isoform X1 [Pecten maximus]|uniref:heterogeneous nuclear ribonucleoprotein K-like isoform X1 n=2 Tax=Pecten maximus TaxID=6579 RepID=UPI0014587ABB|nr:heterogeneous nuclear ribonucleoprotein K-like isoform X1 [Pecten maximus]XP_033750809.1 heterogeneous nuclear ribonucleoprotein K-like isoform X1 [Pecten maximus]
MDDEGNMKRPHEDDYQEDYDNKRRRGGDGGQKIELRFLLASKNAGAIIGKAGSNIKRLRQDYKASVTVPDSTSPERVLTIGADIGTALDCALDIIPKLEDVSDEYKNYKDENFDCEMRLLVHQSQAGCIIGRAGFKIKELREKTGAQIKVYSQCCPQSTERVVAIGGKPKVVIDCVDTIHELLKTAPPKGPNQPYDPMYWDEFLVAEYGGYTSAEGGRGKGGPRGAPQASRGMGMGMGMRGGRPGMGMGMGDMGMGGRGGRGGGMMGGRGGRGGMGGMRGNMGGMRGGGMGGPNRGGRGGFGGGMGSGGMGGSMSGGNMGGNQSNMGGGMGGNKQGTDYSTNQRFGGDGGYGDNYGGDNSYDEGYDNSGGGYGGGNSSGSQGGGNMGQNFTQDNTGGMGQMFGDNCNSSPSSTQVTIPKDLAGAIIGKGGSRIQEIRRQSNAQVVIDEALPGSSDRIITITGSEDQIQNAQYLLQMRVKGLESSFH